MAGIENKLLFILIYLKGNDLQEKMAERFKISQPKANIWLHLLHSVLNQTLNEIDLLPARDGESLSIQLEQLALATQEEALQLEASRGSPFGEALQLETQSHSPSTEEALQREAQSHSPSTEEVPQQQAQSHSSSSEEVPQQQAQSHSSSTEEVLQQPDQSHSPLTEEALQVKASTCLSEEEAIVPELESETLKTNHEVETLIDIELYLHDGFERPINRPLNNAIQKMFYSGKRKQHTLKNILVTDISGYVLFLSNTCEGQKHDKKMADEAGYSLPLGSYLGQDTGFQGFEIPGVNKVQPSKKPRGGELTEEQKKQNRIISKVRVRAEHAIGGIKRCRIVKDKLRNFRSGFKDLVIETCCGLHNLRLQFRPWNYETAII